MRSARLIIDIAPGRSPDRSAIPNFNPGHSVSELVRAHELHAARRMSDTKDRSERKRAAPARLGDYDADGVGDDEDAKKPRVKREKKPPEPKVKINIVIPTGPPLTPEEEYLRGKYDAMRMLAASLRGVRGGENNDPAAAARAAQEEDNAKKAFAAALRAAEEAGGGASAPAQQEQRRGPSIKRVRNRPT